MKPFYLSTIKRLFELILGHEIRDSVNSRRPVVSKRPLDDGKMSQKLLIVLHTNTTTCILLTSNNAQILQLEHASFTFVWDSWRVLLYSPGLVKSFYICVSNRETMGLD